MWERTLFPSSDFDVIIGSHAFSRLMDSEPFKRRRKKLGRWPDHFDTFNQWQWCTKTSFSNSFGLDDAPAYIFSPQYMIFIFVHVDKRHKHSSGQTIWKASRSTFPPLFQAFFFLQQQVKSSGRSHTHLDFPASTPTWSSFFYESLEDLRIVSTVCRWLLNGENQPVGYRLLDWVLENSRYRGI